MTKAELGTKRVCAGCSAKFYDLRREPVVCPKCGTPVKAAKSEPAKPTTADAGKDKPEVTKESDEVEVVSLEALADEEDIPDLDDDVEDIADDDADDDTFLETDDDDDSDVSLFIGDVKEDAEEQE